MTDTIHGDSLDTNPLLSPRLFPAYDQIRSSDIGPGIGELLRISRDDLRSIETLHTNDEARSFQSVDVWMRRVLVPFELLVLRYERAWKTVSLLVSVRLDARFCIASTDAHKAVSR